MNLFNSLIYTLIQSFLSSLVCIVIAFPLSYFLSRYDFVIGKLIKQFYLIPFVLPSIILIVALTSIYGKNGLINKIFNLNINIINDLPGIIAHVYYNLSIAIKFLEDGWNKINQKYFFIYKFYSNNKIKYFFNIILPLLLPSILNSFMFIFIYSFFSFAIVIVFGGLKFATLEVLLYKYLNTDIYNINTLMIFILQFFLSLTFIIIIILIKNKYNFMDKNYIIINKKKLNSLNIFKRIFIYLFITIVLIFLVLPLLSLFFSSFIKENHFTLKNYIEIFYPTKNYSYKLDFFLSLFQSFFISIFSSLICVFLSYFIIKLNKFIDFIIYLPLSLSITSISYFFLLFNFLDNFFLIIFIHIIISIPISVSILNHYLNKIPKNIFNSAKLLGCNKFKNFLYIIFPLYLPGFIGAFLFSLLISLCEITSVFILSFGRIQTITISIYNLINSYQYEKSLSLSNIYLFILFIILFISNYFLNYFNKKEK